MNNNKIQRMAAWMLTLLTVLPVINACSSVESDPEKPVSSETSMTTEAVTEAEPDLLESRKLVSDGLGEYDFDGLEYRIVTADGRAQFLVCEAETGDVIDDAVFQRNMAIEDRFNCKIKIVEDGLYYTNAASWMIKSISSGEDAFDITPLHVVYLGSMALSGYFLNWYELPNIDFSKPWWSASTVNDLTHDNVCLLAIGDMALSALSSAYCVFYNKRLGADYDFPDLYEVVNEGKWTIDYITQLTKDVYVDLNHNGAVDKVGDLFGYTSGCTSNINTYLWAFENPIFRKNGDEMVYSYTTERLPEIIEKLCAVFSQYNGVKVGDIESGHNYSCDLFAQSQTILANGYISMSLTHFRNLEDEFGILPYPKWDEEQDRYYTMADGSHEALAIPKTISNPEAVGTITEAMCAESYKILVPAYYDVALKVKSTRDEQSVAMLDLIVDSRVFDFGYVYDAWRGASFILQELVRTNNTNFESFYKSKEKGIIKHYNKVLALFEDYES